uniref:C2H2-type domain-containing protein n=1 Tax=Anopheles christyi TaxID=43041 RepID=A0A182JNW7_9DIPT
MVGRKSVGGVRTSGTKKEEILVNVQVNGDDEIDLVPVTKQKDYRGVSGGIDREGDEDESDDLSDNPDSDPDLLETEDGRLILDMNRSKHCGKCKKPFKSSAEKKDHKYKCPGVLDEVQDVILKERKAAKHANPGEEFHKYCNPNPDNPCYCCGEDVSTAHVGHIRCKFCPKSFKAYEYMERHLSSIHSESDAFPCCYCNAKCSSQSVLDEHLKTHDEGKPFACMACGKDFTRRYHLDRHEKHTKCGMVTKDIEVLPCELHQRTHDEDNPVQCKVCSGTFKREDCLMRHMRSKHRDYMDQIMEDTEKEKMKNLIAKREAEKEATVEIDGAVYQITTMDDNAPKELCYNPTQTVEVFEVVEIAASAGNATSIALPPTTSVPFDLLPITEDTEVVLGAHEEIEYIDKSKTKSIPMVAVDSVKLENVSINEVKMSPPLPIGTAAVPLRTKSMEMAVAAKPKEAKVVSDKVSEIVSPPKRQTVPSVSKASPSGSAQQKAEVVTSRPAKELPTKATNPSPKQRRENLPTVVKVESVKRVKQAEVSSPPVQQQSRTKEAKAKEAVAEEPKAKRKRESKSSNTPKRMRMMDEDSIPIFLSDEMLEKKISELLQMLMGDEMLHSFGWPDAPVEEVLGRVIRGCGHQPAKGEEVGDHTTRMRENTKILFSVTMDDEDIKALLNNHTVDEVIMHVLKNK